MAGNQRVCKSTSEKPKDNQEWTIQRNWVQKTQDENKQNKTYYNFAQFYPFMLIDIFRPTIILQVTTYLFIYLLGVENIYICWPWV